MKTIFFLLLIAALVEFVYHPSWEEIPAHTLKALDTQLSESPLAREEQLNKFLKHKKPHVEEFQKYTTSLEEVHSLPESSPSQQADSSFGVGILLQTFAITALLVGGVLLGWYFFIYRPHSPLTIALETPSLPTEAPAFIPVEKSPPVMEDNLLKKQVLAVFNRQNSFLNNHQDMVKNMIMVIDKHWQQESPKEKNSIEFLKASQAALQDYLAYCRQYHQYAKALEYPLEKTLLYDSWGNGRSEIPSFSYTPSTEKLLIFHPVLYFFHQPDEYYPFHIVNLVYMTGLMMASEESAMSVLQYLSGNYVCHFHYTLGENTIDYFSPYQIARESQPTKAQPGFSCQSA